MYDASNHGYQRIYAAAAGSKAEGLLHLLQHLNCDVALLAFYGDRFNDPGNDGNAVGRPEIPRLVSLDKTDALGVAMIRTRSIQCTSSPRLTRT